MKDYTCPNSDPSKKRNDFKLRGTSLGGWLVLEPWLTPSLFYQFLGLTEKYGDMAKNHIAIDSKTFCSALGPEEANRQLRQHWKTWVDEEQIRNLAEINVEVLRIPLGDWMFASYEPYIGCMDGAIDELNRVLSLCEKYNLRVLLDIHAVRMSQNGLDNSGDTGTFEWEGVSTLNEKGSAIGIEVSKYRHWDIRGGNWAGNFNVTSQSYSTINNTNIEMTHEVVKRVVELYKESKVVVGITPVNEPWITIPLEVLKDFYWSSYQVVQEHAPHWITLMHDSFRLAPDNWGGEWMKGCDNWALDTHIYQAWADHAPAEYFIDTACGAYELLNLGDMEDVGVPIVVGEWSLATDNCAMWLNGLNDNVPGYPKVQCEFVPCPEPYMGDNQPNAPPPTDTSINTMDPMGSGGPSFVINGTCPRDRSFPGDNIRAVRDISYAKLNVFENYMHGHFFWNFRTEFEPRWDYQMAVELGWIPTDWSSKSKEMTKIHSACLGYANLPPREGESQVKIWGSIAYIVVPLILLLAAFFRKQYWLGQRKSASFRYESIGEAVVEAGNERAVEMK